MKKQAAFLLLLFISFPLIAQDKKESDKDKPDPVLSQTKHQVTVNGQLISYSATTGYLIVREESGKPKGKFFFVAYTKDGVTDPSTRPITYTFNGGPGSSSVWLHMGGLGPKRIEMTDFGGPTKPPYAIIDNEYSWLDLTDMVFIDPVMTGYSRPAEGVEKKEFNGYVEDIETVGEFIYLYTTRYQRWNSPKFLAGESYGTTRAAGLSGHLQDRYGMYLNGIVLISAVLNFQTIEFDRGNELPFTLFLPTYSAMAWYHKKLSPELTDLKSLLNEVEAFALGEYTLALMKGDRLPDDERKMIIDKLSRFTGLSKEYLQQVNLRILDFRFTKELLRKEGKTVGRLDGRFTGSDYDDAGQSSEFDPSYNAGIYGPFTMAVNDHVRRTLKYQNDIPYEILGGRAHPWSYANVQNQYLNVAETLRSAMTKNKDLKVLICNGYFDMATPYFATDYTVNHMFLEPELRKNISSTFYEAGHMVYIHKLSLGQMKKDVSFFYQNTLKK
jgi:carboxypeptidase C (cathepsin A)